MQQKTFVIDTNVLLHDPESFQKFPRSQVVIPLGVVEMLDSMKRLPNELGKNARAVFRLLDGLAKTHRKNLHDGIPLENGSLFRIELKHSKEHSAEFSLSGTENKIILTAYMLQKRGEEVVFVSKDLVSRIKAEALGIEAEDYENLKFSYEALYHGLKTVEVSKSDIDHFFKDGGIQITDFKCVDNEYCHLKAPGDFSALGQYHHKKGRVESLIKSPDIWGIKPRNLEQRCAIDALLREDIKLVTLVGQAGTGKTLLAIACGMRKVFDEGEFSKILVTRPIVPLGRDIGYLPGTKEEKLFHWMQPIYDNLEFLCSSTGEGNSKETMRWVMESPKIEMEAVTYIRGRSLPRMYIIIDEAQNLTPHEVKTIISRAGEGTKVVFTGDPTQIDNPYLDKDSNGLTYLVGKFQNQPLYGHVFLEKTERSALAAMAAEIL